MTAVIPSVDLGALMRTLQTTGVQLPSQLGAPAPVVKPKKKAATVDEKREKSILCILDGKDPFGLHYTGLLLQLDDEALDETVKQVRIKYNRP